MVAGLASRTLFLLLVCLFFHESAQAQPRMGARVQASVLMQEGAVQPGGETMIGVLLDTQRGWKVQAGRGSGDETPPYLATEIRMAVPHGWSAGAPLWPAAKSFKLGDEQLMGYDGKIVVVVPVTVPTDVSPGQHVVQATIRYQACDAAICEVPVTIQAVGDVYVGDAGSAPALDATIASLFNDTLARAGRGVGGAGGTAAPGGFPGGPVMEPAGGSDPAFQPVIQQERREQSWFISYWYLWVIVPVVVIACGVVLWRVLR